MIVQRDRRRPAPIWQWLALLCGAAVLVSSSALATHSHLADHEGRGLAISSSLDEESGAETHHSSSPCSFCSSAARDGAANAEGPEIGHLAGHCEPIALESPVLRDGGFDSTASPRGPPSR